MTVFSVSTAVTLLASSAAATPLYHIYQSTLGLSPLTVTVIFASYAFSLLVTLLIVGSLSDYIGRKPVIFITLVLNILAMLLFLAAGSALMLIAARVVQGIAIGAATTTLGAAILDTDRPHAPMLNGITNFAGLTIGSIAAGLLISFAPLPTQLVFILLLIVMLAEAILLFFMPETAVKRQGVVQSLIPRIRVPGQARGPLLRLTPVNVAAWALGGFYLSLMPTLVVVATHLTSPLVGASVVALLMLAATCAVLGLRDMDARRELLGGSIALILGVAVTLLGLALDSAPVLLIGSLIAGTGFGAAFSGTLRSLLPLAGPDERAGLLATFYIESYLAFGIPAIAAGLVAPMLGLTTTAYLYGAVIVVLAVVSLVATLAGPRREPSVSGGPA
jgi:predicted MFS family arabinose efflux permease